MTWWMASLAGNAAIIAIEYFNRSATGSWAETLLRTAPLIVLAQYFLFVSFNGAPHWFTAWAVFSLGNSVMRVAMVAATTAGGGVASWPQVLAGIAAILAGQYYLKGGLR